MESILHHIDLSRKPIQRLFSRLATGRAYTRNELISYTKIKETEMLQIINDLMVEGFLEIRVNRKRNYYFMPERLIAFFTHRFRVNPEERPIPQGMKYSRHCYKHLAGYAGVKLEEALIRKKYIESDNNSGYEVTEQGRNWFTSIGLNNNKHEFNHPFIAKQCLDFSERKSHLGGQLGDAILSVMLAKGWIEPVENSREMVFSEKGKQSLNAQLGMNLK